MKAITLTEPEVEFVRMLLNNEAADIRRTLSNSGLEGAEIERLTKCRDQAESLYIRLGQ